MPRDRRRYAWVLLHNTEGRSNKFYEVWVEYNDQSTGRSWTACRRWGPITAHGQTLRRAFISRDFAYTEIRDLVTEKAARGYRVVLDNTGDRDPSFGETRNLQGVERARQAGMRRRVAADLAQEQRERERTEDRARRQRLGITQEGAADLAREASNRREQERMNEWGAAVADEEWGAAVADEEDRVRRLDQAAGLAWRTANGDTTKEQPEPLPPRKYRRRMVE